MVKQPLDAAKTGFFKDRLVRVPKWWKRAASILSLLLSLSFLFYPNFVFADGIGFRDFQGDVTIQNSSITNNYRGITTTVTNAATIQNILIYSNVLLDTERHGIKIDAYDSTGGVTIKNNFLDNSNAALNGRFGIRIQNSPKPLPCQQHRPEFRL